MLWASVMSHSNPLTVSEHLSELQSIRNIFPQGIPVQGQQKPCLAVTISVDQVHFAAGFEQVDIPNGARGKEPTFQCRRETQVQFPGLGRSPGGRHGNPLQCFCLENSTDRGAWWFMVHRVAQSRTRLKRLSKHELEKEMAAHSSVLVWRIPGTEEPGGLPSMGSHRVVHE